MIKVNSEKLFSKAKQLFPGGVNSPVRAFKSVGGTPLFIKKGDGCRIWDADGNEFIDFCCSWGPLILGHNNKQVREAIIETTSNGTSFGTPTVQENELGELILSNHRFVERIRFVSSGTEAAMSALRLARGYTGRNKVIKFEGCYHGHVDALLVEAGSGLATLGTSTSAGVPESFAQETIVLPLNDKTAVLNAIAEYKDEIACIAIEPIPANNGLLIQGREFLQFLREVCTENNILLFFDEVISGFRIGFEGAAGFYDIKPDVIAFGKVIGGGMPVGAYASSAEVMNKVSPMGPVYQAGTLSGNPVAMAAGAAALKECLTDGFYEKMESKTKLFIDKILTHTRSKGYLFNIHQMGSIFWLTFSDQVSVRKSSQIDPESMNYFTVLHKELLERGIYLGPSGFEVGFISAAHTENDLELAANAFIESLDIAFSEVKVN
ncbi:MAG TPA: glutamate-1-semialdehyde-2,1-aminomutase [Flavobacteriales bacterium]|nr:glutamate-1-semialdehyde-2,1-aminomutase [Crocinitomicaceae bacterium]HAE30299.1 glutamate-1-semialdehyde-2,1-aminomutase [Flavobacteriales bacterium]|tara:strand:- start:1438 stop:2745 length:1308 start_codon:yes stop_codon:yes gene_type:complete